jgi:hypothetical protein
MLQIRRPWRPFTALTPSPFFYMAKARHQTQCRTTQRGWRQAFWYSLWKLLCSHSNSLRCSREFPIRSKLHDQCHIWRLRNSKGVIGAISEKPWANYGLLELLRPTDVSMSSSPVSSSGGSRSSAASPKSGQNPKASAVPPSSLTCLFE